jgi:uncharacterized protein YeeX (DUF496 family)
MYVNATDFRTNVGKYMEDAQKEDIYVLKHGKPYVIVSRSREKRKSIIESLKGSYTFDGDVDEFILKNRMEDYESLD